jgi:hypothetical protein
MPLISWHLVSAANFVQYATATYLRQQWQQLWAKRYYKIKVVAAAAIVIYLFFWVLHW